MPQIKNIQTRSQVIKSLLVACLLPLNALNIQAQITIGGNVYGGGNQGEVGTGNAKTVYTFDKTNDTDDMTSVIIRSGEIKNVYGGGRMAGVDGNSSVTIDGTTSTDKIIIGNVYGGNDITGTVKGGAKVKSTYNAEKAAKPIYVAKLFGGGNGDYTYGTAPDIAKVAIDLQSGAFGQVFGGGNKATVNTETDLALNNQTDLANYAALSATEKTALEAYGWLDEWFTLTGETYKPTYQFDRVFGGNNKVDMAIRPTWELTKGTIDNLYSGGNMGGMTYPNGILLAISGNDMVINNVYGGCRMADVNPSNGDGSATLEGETVGGVTFDATYAARVLITGGKITNVYGGNDISGRIYHGTQVEIHHSIIGDVYGGGNGSYAYTDNATLKDDAFWSDYYYEIPTDKTSAEALTLFRPNVESSLIHVKGESETNPTTIGGALYCGGNSATLSKFGGDLTGALAELKIGSHVIAKSMFLGSNGANLITGKVHEKVNGSWTDTDILAKYAESSPDFSQMDLTTTEDLEEYMRGVEVAIKPTVTFDDDYQDYSTKVGSFFCGGNVGSLTAEGTFDLNFLNQLVIFEKIVGGCNDANVKAGDYNTFHEGGLTGDPEANSPKVILDINGLQLEPKKLEYDEASNTFSFTNWNTDDNGYLNGGKIYGGCYNSGYINGGVTINLKTDAISEEVKTAANGTTLPTLAAHRDFVFNTALSIFGAGYGEDSEIWGNTIINISDNANIIKVFGGGEMGVVGNLERYTSSSTIPDGKHIGDRTGEIENRYNTTINLTAGNVGKIYGGGFEGPVTGHTTVNLIGGTAYDVIGGACNADIEEYAETYVGDANASTYPTITNNVYGANDFGGQIKGTKNYADRVSTTAADKVYNNSLLTAAAYVEYIKGKVNYIFGGAKAAYDYKDQTLYSKYADDEGKPIDGFVKPAIGNAFVNFRPENDNNNAAKRVYGAGEGYYNERDKDLLQSSSYVLIDIPTNVSKFASMEVFGAGDYSGVGMSIPAATVRTSEETAGDVTAAAVIDLIRGNIRATYGGSYKEGFTRRTIVNVPVGSTINMNYLYGGAYGVASADGNPLGNLYPCDVYESNVNFKSSAARVRTIYGGNNNYRRTIYTHVNIYTPVQYVHQTYGLTHANIFGAGYGENTWAQYTEVNLFDGAKVYEVYGGGEAGNVLNKETVTSQNITDRGWNLDIPGNYLSTDATGDASYDHGGLTNALAHSNQLWEDYNGRIPDAEGDGTGDITIAKKYNTNVHIHRGATVVNYAYGAGLGSHIYTYQFDGDPAGNTEPQPSDHMAGATSEDDLDAEAKAKYRSALAAYNLYNTYHVGTTVGANEYKSFNDTQKLHWTLIGHRTTAVVSGTSYIDLLGGTVTKDLYAAGTTGCVQDTLMLKSFTASSTAYIKGGSARNVYGGGWEGPVGKHDLSKPGTYLDQDVLGETHVIIGRPEEHIAPEYIAANATSPIEEEEFFYFNGVPAINRNAYAGGEGGVVRGTANLNIFNGFIGYKCKTANDITASENNYYQLKVENGHVIYTPLDRSDNLTNENYYFVEEIDQDAVADNIMYEAGNAFGGGYAANSDVDIANLTLWNGIVRNSLYGGGEIATIGRGTQAKNSSTNEFDVTIYKPGETHVTMWGGHVLRNVFGGGRGFNNWKTEDKTDGNTNGYVFGQTDVNIHLGTIGTLDGVSKGDGNVFGGGNVGFVYSQYAKHTNTDSYGNTTNWYYEDYNSTPKKLSEDTRVEVKAYGKALQNVTIDGTSYNKGDYILNTELDKLTNSDNDKLKWAKIDQTGITIYNAVFAGGNVSAGSDKIMAFSKTVYGNSTASVVDIYSRDLISVGGSGVGGLYGDGNLTFVDGYRELNITNYGTDWYSLSGGVSNDEEFNALTPRQQSFYTTQYRCITTYGVYEKGDIIMSDVYQYVADEYKNNWERIQSIVNEGRYINTVQRCDFCGIKGSRIVLHGAIDRAQDEAEADYTNYTINRVGELSLNQNHQSGQPDHGSYFGIYNVVKFLGGVTSDVRFAGDGAAVRQTTSTSAEFTATNTGQTYYQWKELHKNDNVRNDGTAPNKIAIASGVYLEIVKKLDYNGNKVYGPITGVVELDLLNVSPGEGGGYVYAQNIHGTPTYNPEGAYADVISDANKNLVTNRAFTYAAASATDEMQTSGNFIHSQPKRILDDCFPDSKSYVGANASPAHYWYIRGEFYIYDQLISAYTGGANSYSAEMSIPLTMAIQSNAKLRLLNVVPGLYADPAKLGNYTYNADEPELSVSDSVSIVNGAVIKTYGQGDPISYWDWYTATNPERSMFIVETDAMVCNTEATFILSGSDGPRTRTYYPGETISADEYATLSTLIGKNYDNEDVKGDTIFSVINEVNRKNGYLLTVDFSNPSKWDDYYRHLIDQTTDPADPIKKAVWAALTDTEKKNYIKSATFTCKDSGTYGQSDFYKDDIISKTVFDMEDDIRDPNTGIPLDPNTPQQATFVLAYMAKEDCEVSVNGELKSFTKGSPISENDYGRIADADKTYFEPAYICVNTVLVANGDYRVLNQLVGATEWGTWSNEIKQNFQPAFYCTNAGKWGGKFYENGKNYNGLDYGQLHEDEREHFTFNYDALDALLYNNYLTDIGEGSYAYHSIDDYTNYINNVGGTNSNTAISVFDENPSDLFYAKSARLDYIATFNSANTGDQFKYVKDGVNKTVTNGVVLNNEEYEYLPNDRKYYANFAISDDHLFKDKDHEDPWNDHNYHTFIVKNTFDVAGTMYNAGKAITYADYSNLTNSQKANVQEVIITPAQDSANGAGNPYFFCIEKYTIGANDANIQTMGGAAITTPTVTDINGVSHANGSDIQVGTIINYNAMTNIPNYQKNFDISGESPVEETTLYVPVTADIDALQKDRYVTAIYEYSYTESDATGLYYETRVEKHILNIRIKFLSGTPIIGSLKEPDLVLPLETVGLDIPAIQEGAFPILGGGWEIFPSENHAKRHRNGREYNNGGEPLYFYENDYYVAYYALTRMGKTFSDPVPLHVANYQRMADVLTDENHMFINHRDNDRDPKIYIDGRSTDTYGSNITYTDTYHVTRTYSNELDAMQGVWDLVNSDYGTLYNTPVDGKSRNITGAHGLEFFLQNEVGTGYNTWTSIGDDTHCFAGTFHGNGNTITGLDNSLFGKLCGSVYNLGVMGRFTSGGIADTGDGRIENSWVWSTRDISVPVYANPGSDARVINTYYPATNSTFAGSTGNIERTPRHVEDFVNGSVAYDLNRYYLEARYRLNGQVDGSTSDHIFYRLPDGTIVKNTDKITDANGKQPGEEGYEDTYDLITDANGKEPGDQGYITTYANQMYEVKYADADYVRFVDLSDNHKMGYVEKYVDDGDFRFSDGKKPKKPDMRLSTTEGYLPIYPDDYIFFGQKLTYSTAHATHPQAAAKSHTTGSDQDVDNSKHGLLINDINDRSENRIYRAPAYFRNGIYNADRDGDNKGDGSVIFNARAVFVDNYNFTVNGTSYETTPHRGMTAIDFTGGNGDTHGYQGVVAGLAEDFKDRANGYAPLLDYERLDAFETDGLTQNLLAYTPKADLPGSKNTQTNNVLVDYFLDHNYAEVNPNYRNVAVQNTNNIRGHVVQQASTDLTNGNYTYQALVDHLLVDKQDFNAPMAYTFADGKRMWYQRVPDNYVVAEWSNDATPVRTSKGWEGVSIPFEAELVTTQTKGEITHFYKNSSNYERGYDSGHEYWLRDFASGGTLNGDVYEAKFNYPEAISGNTKENANTFLWDYYYSKDTQQDANTDIYQEYYKTTRTYNGYPYSDAGKPYIVGFPGKTYYEFDLSGNFKPEHTYGTINKLPKQVITFASPTGASIDVSDTQMAGVTEGDYTFKPSYLNEEYKAANANTFMLNSDGSSFETVNGTETTPVVSAAFRPYFKKASGGGAPRRIIISGVDNTSLQPDIDERHSSKNSGDLKIYAESGKIVVESALKENTTVRITTASGIDVATFTIEPGQTISTPVNMIGVYIVNRNKILVK
ncbi:MAG: hypothetical protein IKH43_02920 [Bacteroidaceae bacterium]|nr:hypothetical protein [Bacteroidaceae bacterium]